MMKKTSLVLILLALVSCKVETSSGNEKVKAVLKDPITNVFDTVNEQSLKIQERAAENYRLAKEREDELKLEKWKQTLTKVWVRAKPTKECLKLLKTDVINEEVIKCNKDRYVEVRNDEVDKFKLEQGL